MAIRLLTENDCLLGRGLDRSKFVGNKRFHALVKTRFQEYISTKSCRAKAEIAEALYDAFKQRGGRFLVQVNTRERVTDIVKEGTWMEAPKKVGLEKIKQALRDAARSKGDKDGAPIEVCEESESFSNDGNEPESMISETVTSGGSFAGTVVCPASRLDEKNDSQIHHIHTATSSLSPIPVSILESGDLSRDSSPLLFEQLEFENEERSLPSIGNGNPFVLEQPLPSTNVNASNPGTESDNLESSDLHQEVSANALEESEAPTNAFLDDSTSESLLSMLGYGPNTPRFTDEDLAIEQDALTEKEKASAFADVFGKMWIPRGPEDKKARRDFDNKSILFLLRQMKLGIVKIPIHKKQALLEATTKCRREEFSDERLEVFLRSQGMNAELAAERFVTYWQCRYEVFGPDKYALPMTLTGALRDDLVALQAGMLSLLPHPDFSGHRIMFAVPRRNTRKGYAYESLIRVTWYLVEIITREPGYDGGGYVIVVDDKDATLFDYDSQNDSKVLSLMKTAWPVKSIPIHCCCASNLVIRILKPFALAFMSKEMRSRCLVHDVQASDVPSTLAPYGITREMLPTELGGDIVHNQYEWIQNRRAIEMGLLIP